MRDVEEIERILMRLRGAVASAERVREGKVETMHPITRERVKLDVPPAVASDIAKRIDDALRELKAKVVALEA